MKSKSFLILIIVLCVLSAITYFVLQKQQTTVRSDRMGEPLFESFPLSEVAAITITGRDGGSLRSVKLRRGDNQWIVENLFDYPAAFRELSDLVRKLAESKIGRSFPASEDIISRLALISPRQENVSSDKTAILVVFSGGDGSMLAEVLVGKPRESSAGAAGHYVIAAEEDKVLLVDQSFRNLSAKPSAWIEKELLNIEPDAIKTVTAGEPGRESPGYVLKRPEKGKAPEFADPPEDKKIKKHMVNSIFDVLSRLQIEDVAGFSENLSNEKTGFENASRLKFHLFDGTIYTLVPGNTLENNKAKHYLKVEASFEAPQTSEAGLSETESSDASNSGENAESGDPTDTDTETVSGQKPQPADTSDKPDKEKMAEAVSEQNEKLSHWVYVISDWEYKSLITSPDEFFEEEKQEN